jgi:DNA polymerase III epsilon subunit family exonuclease
MRVAYFPSKVNLPKMEKLENGLDVVLFGNIEEDSFSSGLTMRPKSINLCVFEDGFFEKVYSKPVPKNYTIVFPEPFVSTKQSNLFLVEDEITNDYLLSNTFVVFDLETTGTVYNRDKIIEIGAIKIEGGKLTDTFSCLIDPEIHIPDDASKVNNIFDKDVEGCPTIEKVLPDFFKFCDGSIMVSYVIDFDFNFISHYGKLYGYTFTNETFDAFVLAKQRVKGVKNYKLVTIAKELGVELENAHRAVFDAVATAEVMINLLKNN